MCRPRLRSGVLTRGRAAALLMMTLALAGPAAAEDGATVVTAGDKVRLTSSDGGRFTATVLEVQPDALLLRVGERAPERIPLSALRRLEVARGRRGRVKEGALIGFVPGFVFGAYAGHVIGCDDQGPDCTALDSALAAGAMAGGLTAVAGGLVGLAIRTDRWTEVPPRARVGGALAPVRGGVVGLIAVSF